MEENSEFLGVWQAPVAQMEDVPLKREERGLETTSEENSSQYIYEINCFFINNLSLAV